MLFSRQYSTGNKTEEHDVRLCKWDIMLLKFSTRCNKCSWIWHLGLKTTMRLESSSHSGTVSCLLWAILSPLDCASASLCLSSCQSVLHSSHTASWPHQGWNQLPSKNQPTVLCLLLLAAFLPGDYSLSTPRRKLRCVIGCQDLACLVFAWTLRGSHQYLGHTCSTVAMTFCPSYYFANLT